MVEREAARDAFLFMAGSFARQVSNRHSDNSLLQLVQLLCDLPPQGIAGLLGIVLLARLLGHPHVFWPIQAPVLQIFRGDLLGPVPQMLLGIAMVMVFFENERNAVQENALAFSTLGVDPMRLLAASDLVPSMQSILDRLVAPLPTSRAAICISERWRAVLPSVQLGFSPQFIAALDATGAGEYVCELSYRRGGFVSFPNLAE